MKSTKRRNPSGADLGGGYRLRYLQKGRYFVVEKKIKGVWKLLDRVMKAKDGRFAGGKSARWFKGPFSAARWIINHYSRA